MRRLLASYVGGIFSDILYAEDGLEALEVLDGAGAVDVALVDLDMPRMGGLEFVRHVRSRPENAGMKLLMVTSHTSMEAIGSSLESGADDFLMKPMTEGMVLDKLRLLGVVA